MPEPSQLTHHIDSYVDASRSSSHHASSLGAIVYLVKNNELSVEALVKEMGLYLTSTDFVVRARGILLLAEVIASLRSKPLDDATVHSLIDFFANRLADWKALHGALVGCLALMKRKKHVGAVSIDDAKAVTKSFLENIMVQSLGQHDRKLCFELLECLLEYYPDAVSSLGNGFLFGLCGAIDGEKDPQCLMLTFHLIELLVQAFPDPSGPLADFVGELSEILGSYFPIQFTHPEGEEISVKRDDLSRALMLAYTSTPLFEPFTIQLYLEKLSSSLLSAQVDSLKYLSYSVLKYGAERIAKHAEAIWSSTKETIYKTPLQPVQSFVSDSLVGLGFHENTIIEEALNLLEKLIKKNNGFFSSLIVKDRDINKIMNTITSYGAYNDIPMDLKHTIHASGRILFVTARTSVTSCNKVFESFFPCLMDILGISQKITSSDKLPDVDSVLPVRLNCGALYLCTELLSAGRDLVTDTKDLASGFVCIYDPWFAVLKSYSEPLIKAFCSFLATSTLKDVQYAENCYIVKSLEILATFPEGSTPFPNIMFESILLTFISIVTMNYKETFLWRLSLKLVAHIGSFIHDYPESNRALSYMRIVVEKIVSIIPLDEPDMPITLKMEVAAEIGSGGLDHMLKIVEGLEGAVYANLSGIYVNGNAKSAKTVVHLLDCYSNRMLPWVHDTGRLDEVLERFPNNIWNQIENCSVSSFRFQEKGPLDALMTAMRLAVCFCSVQGQNTIINKAYNVLSSRISFQLKKFRLSPDLVQMEGALQEENDIFFGKDGWILSLFASTVIALRPEANIPDIRVVLNLLMTAVLKGNVSAAQALGSVLNKMSNETMISSEYTLEEPLDAIFKTFLRRFSSEELFLERPREVSNGSGSKENNAFLNVAVNVSLQMHAIVGLTWIGKGLLLRGHKKIKIVTMSLFGCLLPNDGKDPLQDLLESSCVNDVHPSKMKCAADAFHILMHDSEVCLNKRFHAVIKPLHKQRFFSTMMPILQSLIVKFSSPLSRSMLYRASAHIISNTPLAVILSEAKKLVPIILESLSMLSKDKLDNDTLYSLLLVFSGIVMGRNGQEEIVENAHIIIDCLVGLASYPHMMLVRETAIQCLVAMSLLPHSRIYPMKKQVLSALSVAVDDPKRAVRQEAVRCKKAWLVS